MNFANSWKPFAWGLVGGAIGWWVILAFVFDWTSAGTAQQQAARQSEEAVIAALAPVCADRFLALSNVAEKKASLAKAETWQRQKLFPEDWVTLPGESSPDLALVSACSKIVLDTPAAGATAPDAKEKDASLPASNG